MAWVIFEDTTNDVPRFVARVEERERASDIADRLCAATDAEYNVVEDKVWRRISGVELTA